MKNGNDFKITSASVTAVDFENVKPETLMDFLKLLGFSRYVSKHWIVTKKCEDERYDCEQDESPDGLYTGFIVPEQYYNQDMFVIPKEYLERIVTALIANQTKNGKCL